MTKMNACRIALAILLSVTLSAQGRKTVEFANKQKTTHYFDNAGEWKCGTVNNVLPVAGDEVQIAAYVNTCTLYITNDTTLAARKILVKGGYTDTYSPGTLRFVGDGCSFLMPSLPANPTDADGTVRPILWRVLEVKDQQAYLMSEYILFAHRVDPNCYPVNKKTKEYAGWETSELFNYLNQEFLQHRKQISA